MGGRSVKSQKPVVKTLYVKRIDDQGDRVLLYGDDPDYYVIAEAGFQVEVGKPVRYEMYGINFGFLFIECDVEE